MKIYFTTRQTMREFTKKAPSFKNGTKEQKTGKAWPATNTNKTETKV